MEKPNSEEIKEIMTVKFQKECHAFIESIIEKTTKKHISHGFYQDATNSWLFRKLSELQYQIDLLTTKLEE